MTIDRSFILVNNADEQVFQCLLLRPQFTEFPAVLGCERAQLRPEFGGVAANDPQARAVGGLLSLQVASQGAKRRGVDVALEVSEQDAPRSRLPGQVAQAAR